MVFLNYVRATMLILSAGLLAPSLARAQAPASPPSTWRWSLANLTRVEVWNYFEPRPGGGDPDYAFLANQLRVDLTGTWPAVDVAAGVQYVQFGGLPTDASGPGALGTGALYYDHSGRRDSHQVYLKRLDLRAKLPGGLRLQVGRFGYASGGESPSGRPKIEAVKRARLDARLIGEFEWSLYQRAFDGVRGDLPRKTWQLTGTWFWPTQGGFEDAAGVGIDDLSVATGTLTLHPGTLLPATDVAVFAYRYDDDRAVTGRPDNTGRRATQVDIGITTFGASAVGSAKVGGGELDWLGWAAVQTGSWYEQSHDAWWLAAEAGYHWSGVRWQPWLRGGYSVASGDGNPSDDRHDTFFQMLPTGRRYAYTASYAHMNLKDAFAEIVLRPSPAVTVRGDVRRLWLADAADRWYAGSGATQQRGTIFGFAGRPSGGSTDFGQVFEGSAAVTLSRRWSVNGFLGTIHGGRVVRSLFADDWLTFFYVEHVVRF